MSREGVGVRSAGFAVAGVGLGVALVGVKMRRALRMIRKDTIALRREFDRSDVALGSGTRDGFDVEPVVRQVVEEQTRRALQQVEVLFNLYAVLPVTAPLPLARPWAASPDLLLYLVEVLAARAHQRVLVVECGSGMSTVVTALAMRQFDVDGRVVSLEHQPQSRERVLESAARLGVADTVDVRLAPLETFELHGASWPWYAKRAWEDLTDIDVLFVDGPPKSVGPQARYPAIPLLRKRTCAGALVVLDDARREDERLTLDQWQQEFELDSVERLPHEKGTVVLRL